VWFARLAGRRRRVPSVNPSWYAVNTPVCMLSRYNIPLWVKPLRPPAALILHGARRRIPVYMLIWYKFHYGLNFR